MIKYIAEAENMTVSALIRRSLKKVDNPITVNLDNSDLRDLVIQARLIDSTVRAFLRNMDFNNHDSIKVKKEIEQNLIKIEEAVLGEIKKAENIVSRIENLSREEAVEFAEKVINNNLESVNEIKGHFE